MNLRRHANYWLNRLEIAIRSNSLLSHPIELCIEPTNRCISECMMCIHPVYRRKKSITFGDMDWDLFLSTRPFWKSVRSIELSGNGEPFLNKRYADMAFELKKSGCFVHCFTNGLLLDEPLCEKLVEMEFDLIGVSLDGATPTTYKTVRGIDGFERVVSNFKRLQKIKHKAKCTKPEVHFNLVAMNSVIRELSDIVRLAAELGVTSIDMFHLLVYFDHVRHESPWLNLESAQVQLEKASQIAQDCGVALSLPSFEPKQIFCRHPFDHFCIRWDGVVVSCPGHRFLLGDLKQQSAREIWNSWRWRKLRLEILRHGYESVCPHCHVWQANKPSLLLHALPTGGDGIVDLRDEKK